MSNSNTSRKRRRSQTSPTVGLDKHEIFTQWSKARGVEIDAVKPASLPHRGIGLVTTGKVKQGTRILFVPAKAMFKPDANVNGKDNAKEWQQKASPQAQLALSIARECYKQDSPYIQWISTWPSYEDIKAGMPLFWSDNLKGLLPPGIQQPLERQVQDLEKDVAALRSFGDVTDGWTREPFEYYWAIVNSRSFHFKPAGSKPGYMVLCPFIDYMNHGSTGTGVTVKQTPKGYEVNADKDYDPGEEIIATYGSHPNDKLLVHYGFIMEFEHGAPSDDDIRLDHLLLPDMPPSTREALQDVGFLGGYALLPASNEICFKTQVAVRAILLTANEWEYFIANGEDLSSDQSKKVRAWLMPKLKEYRQTCIDKQQELTRLKVERKEQEAVRLLRQRWKQIQDAVEVFLDG